jgi:hypothetical protein
VTAKTLFAGLFFWITHQGSHPFADAVFDTERFVGRRNVQSVEAACGAKMLNGWGLRSIWSMSIPADLAVGACD